jgi:hypothetical protein
VASYDGNKGKSWKNEAARGIANELGNDTFLSCEDRNLSCPDSWVYCVNGHCNCGTVPYNLLRCDFSGNVAVIACNCATFNEIDGILEVGECMKGCGQENIANEHRATYPLPHELTDLNVFMCGALNRTGTLCGSCQDGLYPLAYSFDIDCVECPNGKSNWWKFVLVAFLPLTAFYFIILFFHVNVTSSILLGFVTGCQTIAMPILMRAMIMKFRTHPKSEIALRISAILCGIWNLDFLRSLKLGICLETDTLQTLTLDIAIGIYPIALIMLTYFLIELHDRNLLLLNYIWKPVKRILHRYHSNFQIRTSLIDAFSTFILLSNVKFMSVGFDLLVPVEVYQLNSTGHLTKSWNLYYDATVPYFGKRHLPFAFLALAIFTLFVLLPLLILFLYPFRCFQKALNLFPVRMHILHTFVDAFVGCYKDGTEPNTRDCRWFISVLFLTRIFNLANGLNLLNVMVFPFTTMLLVIIVILQVQIQPFKQEKKYSSLAFFLFMILLAIWHVSIVGHDISKEKGSMVGNIFLFFAGLVIATFSFFLFCPIVLWCWHNGGRRRVIASTEENS